MILRDSKDRLPADAFKALAGLTVQLSSAEREIGKLEARIMQWHRRDATSRRLVTILGIGPVTASAISASVPDASLFRSGRQFAARLGLTPRANSSGGKDRLTGITKQGDGYLRRLLVVGATAVLRYARKGNSGRQWAMRLLERKRPKVVAVALANKLARIAWGVLHSGRTFETRRENGHALQPT